MDLGELCLRPVENLADSKDKKGKRRWVKINENPAKKKAIKAGGNCYEGGLPGKSGSTLTR